jgi:hypothetical protein
MFFQLLLLAPLALSQRLPLYPPHHSHACNAPTNSFPFCNTSLPIPARVADLISRLTLPQKIANRYDLEAANPALGLNVFNYNQEYVFKENQRAPKTRPTNAPPNP